METKKENYEIPLLTAADVECRVGMVKQGKKGYGCSVLLYKNARCDMRILDEVFGVMGWQRSHEVIGKNLYCTVSVKDPVSGEWIRKQDVGTESNTEAEKGAASDAFKRACTNIGIGRELYTAPFLWVPLDQDEIKRQGDKIKTDTTFNVVDIEYDDNRRISRVVIADDSGCVRLDKRCGDKKSKTNTTRNTKTTTTTKTNTVAKETAASTKSTDAPAITSKPQTRVEDNTSAVKFTEVVGVCNDCKCEIRNAKVVAYSNKEFGVTLCMKCQDKRRAVRNNILDEKKAEREKTKE